MARPLKRTRPRLVPNVVADPVVLAHVDQRTYATLEERRDVVVREPVLVAVSRKCGTDFVATRGEVGGDGGVNAELCADRRAVEVG